MPEIKLGKEKHTDKQNKTALKWVEKEFGKTSGQTRGAKKIGPARWIIREYGIQSSQYRRIVLGEK